MRPQKGKAEKNWQDFTDDWVCSFFNSPQAALAFSSLPRPRWRTWHKQRFGQLRCFLKSLHQCERIRGFSFCNSLLHHRPVVVHRAPSEDLLLIIFQANKPNFCLWTWVQDAWEEKFISFSTSRLITVALTEQEPTTRPLALAFRCLPLLSKASVYWMQEVPSFLCLSFSENF